MTEHNECRKGIWFTLLISSLLLLSLCILIITCGSHPPKKDALCPSGEDAFLQTLVLRTDTTGEVSLPSVSSDGAEATFPSKFGRILLHMGIILLFR